MLCTQYFLLFLIYAPINHANQNDLSLLSNNYQQRIKRFLSRKSFKSKLNTQTQSKNNQEEDILLNNGLYVPNNNGKSSQREPNKGYTQQELTEIKRILSKKEDDYYGILAINNQATREKIMNAYKRLTLRVHPDKFNAPGATEATQRLNKARTELLRRFEYSYQTNNQQTTKRFTSQSPTTNENKHREVIDTSNLISTFSPLPSETEPSIGSLFYKKSNYILLASIIFIIGIIIFIIYWMKRQHRSSSSTDGRTKNRDSEVSILQEEE